MAAPTGSEFQIGWGFGTRVTTNGESVWRPPVANFLRVKSAAGLVAKRTLNAPENMEPSNQQLRGTQSQAMIAPKLSLNPDVNSIPKLLVHFAGKDATITTPSGGTTSRQWVIAPYERGDTAPASFVDDLFFEADDGDDAPLLVVGARMQDLGIKIDNGKFQTLDVGFLACRDTYVADAAVLVGPGAGAYSGKPVIIGHYAQPGTWPLKLKVTAVASGGFDGTVKFTTATYAGLTTTQIKFNVPFRVVLDTGARVGVNRSEDLWCTIPSATGTLTLNDEWSFAATRTAATASYSTRDPLEAAGLTFTVGGVEYYVRSAEVKITRPRKANFVAGSKYALTIQKNGKWSATITLDRDREDREFLKKLIDASSFAISVKMYGNPIEGVIDELWQIDFANCQVSDDQRDVTTENTLPEKIEIVAHRSGSTDIFTSTVICTVTAL